MAVLHPLLSCASSRLPCRSTHQKGLKFQSLKPPQLEIKQLCCSKTSALAPRSFVQPFPSTSPPLRRQNPPERSDSELLLLSSEPAVDVHMFSERINDFVDRGLFEDAVRSYIQMLEYVLPVEEFQFFPRLIKAFGWMSDVERAKQIHGHVLKLGTLDAVEVANSVLGMYWKCGAVDHAVRMFGKMLDRDSVTWNTMVSGARRSGDFSGSLGVFSQMVGDFGVYPNRVACLSALSACASVSSLIHGRELHSFVVKNHFSFDRSLACGIIDMYMKCRDIRSAENVVMSVVEKESVIGNSAIWNAMVLGYLTNGCLSEASVLLAEMFGLGVEDDSSIIVAALVFCSHSLDSVLGEKIHGLVCKFGMEKEIRVATALMDMYLKCGKAEAGQNIFSKCQTRNIVMWGTLISNYVKSDLPTEALDLCHKFIDEYGFADSVVVLTALRACSSLTLIAKGREFHGLAIKVGLTGDVFVGGALVDLYAKCTDIESAQIVLHGLPLRDLVPWNALISGYTQNDLPDEALKSFRDMQLENIRPNTVTIASILSVCAQISAFSMCREVHGYTLRQGFESSVLVSNSLISTYAKCGDICSARIIFDSIQGKNQISWNSIILGLGMHGRTDEMFALFEIMKSTGVMPDRATFTALLSACSHSGRVDRGWEYFKSMAEDHKLEPQLEQYTCMVDLLGRTGHLDHAYDLIMSMPFAPDDRIWGSLLGSCKTHGDGRLADVVAGHIFEIDPDSIGYRVLLAKLHEFNGKHSLVANIRSDIQDKGLKKQPGCSWIEIDSKMHAFIAGDHSHRQSQEVYATLDCLTREILRLSHTNRSNEEDTEFDVARPEKLLPCDNNRLFIVT
ncbi:putative pentatricopeptide repeat-containing protein At3g11460, mitochondrial [Syzygium oleosum]|uniref:putative pentatricopeptide repeat-containing protein At3g11460, mitochondrial n=1 Tax=Syzygium oleosum TaxID=219896 RepID=UPI0024BBA554|nr:putative pentatricopeptide repeat-containing protein At3g11460, mitochondrial [Syzygium oleosum]